MVRGLQGYALETPASPRSLQLRAAGIEVKDPERYPGLGRFTRLHDPEGNAIELWQPE